MTQLFDRRARAIVWQALLLAVVAGAIWWMVRNASANLERQNIASGFGFLSRTAGFDISQTLITYTNTDTYARAFWVGLTNTLLVAALGIVFATALGFILGIARLSSNWLVSRLALVYVEIVRNIPLLLWLFAIYFGVLLRLPSPGQSAALPLGATLNQRGLYFPTPVMTLEWWAIGGLTAAGLVMAGLVWLRRSEGGYGLAWIAVPLLPAALAMASAPPLAFEVPTLTKFNLEGGGVVQPEFLALLIGLVTYTGAYIGEIVRAGIQSVPEGQRQAASALGLGARDTLRFVVVPQALRAIIPPLTNQYVNLAKNSSLAVAVGYPDLVSVFAGTILNHTNQAVETIAITMAVYLTMSLTLAVAMNALNARVALVER
jgi:general L-amino acid transport system permease protein